MWLSSVILAPMGAFLTYKANNDSVVFNAESYINALQRLFGLRSKRHLMLKEVVIDTPDYTSLVGKLEALRDDCKRYAEVKKLWKAPSYIRIFFRSKPDHRAEELDERMEAIISELENARDAKIIQKLNELPIIYVHAHTTPFENQRLNRLVGTLFPIGLVLYARLWRFRIRMHRDMRQIHKTAGDLIPMIRQIVAKQQTTESATNQPED